MEIPGKKTITLLSEQQIDDCLKNLAAELAADYGAQDITQVTLVVVLHGGMVLGSKLLQMLADEGLDVILDTVKIESYGASTTSSGQPCITKDPSRELSDKHVIVFEDLIDTGLSMKKLFELLDKSGASSLALAAFLVKLAVAEVDVSVDYTTFYTAFTLSGNGINSPWVQGAGIDTAEANRGTRQLQAVVDEGGYFWVTRPEISCASPASSR